jgi:hypothetical protein
MVGLFKVDLPLISYLKQYFGHSEQYDHIIIVDESKRPIKVERDFLTLCDDLYHKTTFEYYEKYQALLAERTEIEKTYESIL